MTYGTCKTKCCEQYAEKGKLCRFCQGRRNYSHIVALRNVFKAFGLMPKPKLPRPKKKEVKPKPQDKFKLVPVAAEDMKIGATISLHGKVLDAKPFQRTKKSEPGFLFTTDQHPNGCFYPEGATVWTVRKVK